MLEHCVRELLNRTPSAGWAFCVRSRSSSRTIPRARRKCWRRSTTRKTPPRGRARSRSLARSTSSATTSWRRRPGSSSGSRPGREVRLRYAYLITCHEAVKDPTGKVVELRCTYDPASRGGNAPDGRKVKATLHWVSAAHAVPAEVHLYDHLFTRPDPGAGADALDNLNPDSRVTLQGCRLEPGLSETPVGKPGSVRTTGLLLSRPRFGAPVAGVQPHRPAARHLGEDPCEGPGRSWMRPRGRGLRRRPEAGPTTSAGV